MAESIEDRITRLVLSATDTEGIHVTIPAHALNREMHDALATARREALLDCWAVEVHSVRCPICRADVQRRCFEGCPRWPRFRAAISALIDPAAGGEGEGDG